MDFFSKVKRAFGFTEDGSDFEDEIRVDSRTTPYVNPFRKDGVDKPVGAATQAASAQDTTSSASDAEVAALKEQMRQMMTMMRNMQAQQVRQAEMPQSHETLKTETKPAKPHHREEQQDSDESDIKQRLQLSEVQRCTAQERANALTEKIEQLQVRISTLENDKKGLLNKGSPSFFAQLSVFAEKNVLLHVLIPITMKKICLLIAILSASFIMQAQNSTIRPPRPKVGVV